MTSKRKIRANQENAKKSTGPTSPEGKDTASGNSYKHGIWAKELVILKEESADYEKLVTDLYETYFFTINPYQPDKVFG